jgi:hypothetical protein
MRITQVNYTVTLADGPEDWTPEQIASVGAHAILRSDVPVAGVMFTDAVDLTEEEWEAVQAQAIAEQRAAFV